MQVEAGYNSDVNFCKIKPDYVLSFTMVTSWREWKVTVFSLALTEISNLDTLTRTNSYPKWKPIDDSNGKLVEIKNNKVAKVILGQLDDTTKLKNDFAL